MYDVVRIAHLHRGTPNDAMPTIRAPHELFVISPEQARGERNGHLVGANGRGSARQAADRSRLPRRGLADAAVSVDALLATRRAVILRAAGATARGTWPREWPSPFKPRRVGATAVQRFRRRRSLPPSSVAMVVDAVDGVYRLVLVMIHDGADGVDDGEGRRRRAVIVHERHALRRPAYALNARE